MSHVLWIRIDSSLKKINFSQEKWTVRHNWLLSMACRVLEKTTKNFIKNQYLAESLNYWGHSIFPGACRKFSVVQHHPEIMRRNVLFIIRCSTHVDCSKSTSSCGRKLLFFIDHNLFQNVRWTPGYFPLSNLHKKRKFWDVMMQSLKCQKNVSKVSLRLENYVFPTSFK